jgi:hypothetical protein
MNEITTTVNTTSTSTSKVGRPATKLKLILNKSFTLKDLQALNPDIKPITIRASVLRGLDRGTYTKLPRTVQTGKKGKPANIFINTKVYKANLSNLSKSKTTVNINENQPVTA